jgi:hypothetical protein
MIGVNDFLYGKMELPAVFADLLKTDALKRLAGIHQSGAIFLVNPDICHSQVGTCHRGCYVNQDARWFGAGTDCWFIA